MKQKSKLWLLYVFCLMAIPMCSLYADELATLTIHFADGTKSDIQLYTRPSVTFEDDNVVFTSPVAKYSYKAQEVLRFTYSGVTDAVVFPETDVPFRQEDGKIVFDDSVSPSNVMLFSEDGKRQPVRVSKLGGRVCLSLSALPAGVYLLKVNGRTSKILKP